MFDKKIKKYRKTKLESYLTGVLFCVIFFSGFLVCQNVQAADHYVRADASGINDGSDWINAWTSFPAASALVRGDTYYVGVGTYNFDSSTYQITKAVSGALYITFKKAVVADHGTDTGWDSSYAGQAQLIRTTTNFNAEPVLYIQTSYVIFDGTVGSGSDVSTYGFKFLPPTDGCSAHPSTGMFVGTPSGINTLTNIYIYHTAFVGCGMVDPICTAGVEIKGSLAGDIISNITIDHCYFDAFNTNLPIYRSNNGIISNNYFKSNWSCPPGGYCHGQQIGLDGTADYLLYNNTFAHTEYALLSAHSGTGPNWRWKIFNNIVNGQGATFNLWIDGGIGSNSNIYTPTMGNFEIYHNTHLNVVIASWGAVNPGPLTDPVGMQTKFYNNIFYNSSNPTINCSTAIICGVPGCDGYNQPGNCSTPSVAHDNNAYLKDTGNYSGNGTVTAETNGQIDANATDPFTDAANGDYTIKAGALPINHGKTGLGATYALDKAGNTRDAMPDIGAYEYVSGTTDTTPPSAPSGLSVN